MKKKKVCKKGLSCGVSCISQAKTCRKVLSSKLGESLDKAIKPRPEDIPEAAELARASKEWTDKMGFANVPYHDHVHILVHKMLGLTSKEINPTGKDSVSWKEEAMVEYFIYEYFNKDYGLPSREARMEKAIGLIKDVYEQALEMGFKKTAELYTEDKREAMAKDIVDRFDSVEPETKEKAMRILTEVRAGKYNNYSESERLLQEELEKRRALFFSRMNQIGEENV